MDTPVLQVALDVLELRRALTIAAEAVAGGADWIEAGTPLIKSEGMEAVRALRKAFPRNPIVADMKVADTGGTEVEMAAKAGASVVCILGDADDTVVAEAVRTAHQYGVKLMADLLNTPEPVGRAKVLAAMGVDLVNAHVGIDQQMIGKESLTLLRELTGVLTIPVAVAGGLDAGTAGQAVLSGASVIIVGGAIIRSADVTASARAVRSAMDWPSGAMQPLVPVEESLRSIFSTVSTPNISDAMHRKGAMSGLIPLMDGIRFCGPAVTVRTAAGDWAKPVEAIDQSPPGTVLVIDAGRVTDAAVFGELAARSCLNRKITGVVIDGGARDAEDIREIRFPVYCRAVVPNAGDPKGFGEINAEILCGGQAVRPGDWIVADESGVVVVPRERALEIARRAEMVAENEARIREEIRRGGTLSEVAELLRWEKRG